MTRSIRTGMTHTARPISTSKPRAAGVYREARIRRKPANRRRGFADMLNSLVPLKQSNHRGTETQRRKKHKQIMPLAFSCYCLSSLCLGASVGGDRRFGQ